MIGKILGAVAGNQVAKQVRGIDGTGGAVLGVVATTVLRRLGPVGLIAAAAGGYALKKYADRRQAARLLPPPAVPAREPTRTQA